MNPTKAQHTPGTWYTRHGQISSMESTHGCTIANCNRTSRGISDEEAEANATLISAAPDLLEALSVAILRVELANAEGDMILSAWLRDARAAVQKATTV